MLKVSVITISYNSKEHVKLTLDTLKKQDYPCIESVIVDGGSTDGTVEVIKAFADTFKGEVKWVSEKDKGSHDAINKGIQMASGDIIGCCFDLFANRHVISEIVNKIEMEHTDGVHGDLVYIGKDGEIVRYWKMGQGTIQAGWMPAHPTLYLKKEVYEKYGTYDERYHCSGDYEFMVRILKDQKCRLSYIPKIMIQMFYGGISTNGMQAYYISLKEAYLALCRNKVRFPAFVIWLRMIRTFQQFRKKKRSLKRSNL